MGQQFGVGGFVGLGIESTYGTAVSRTEWARIVDAEITRKHGQDPTVTSRGPGAEDASLGSYDPRWRVLMEARPEELGLWLRWFHGSGSVASAQEGATTAYKHTFSHKDTVLAGTLERRIGTLNKSDILDGAVPNELSIMYTKHKLMVELKGLGRKDTIDNTPSTPTFGTKRAFLHHDLTATLAGSTVGVRSAKLSFKRLVTEDDYESGSRYRKGADGAAFEASFEADLLFKDLALLKLSLGGASAVTPADDPRYSADKFVWTSSENAGTGFPYRLEVDTPRAFWEPIGLATPAADGIMQRVNATVLMTESTQRLWQMFLTNTKTSI